MTWVGEESVSNNPLRHLNTKTCHSSHPILSLLALAGCVVMDWLCLDKTLNEGELNVLDTHCPAFSRTPMNRGCQGEGMQPCWCVYWMQAECKLNDVWSSEGRTAMWRVDGNFYPTRKYLPQNCWTDLLNTLVFDIRIINTMVFWIKVLPTLC